MALTQLLTSLATSLERAQTVAHLASRDAAKAYGADKLLRTYRIPNFEFESVEIEVPLVPRETIPLEGSPLAFTLASSVIISKARLPAKKAAIGREILSEELHVPPAEAEALFQRVAKEEVALGLVDQTRAEAIRRRMLDAGIHVRVKAVTVKGTPAELVVDTDVPRDRVGMTLRIRVAPARMQLVRDGGDEPETLLLERAD